MQDVSTVRFEKIELRDGREVVRLIAFERSVEGYTSVYDILEVDADRVNGLRWLAEMAVVEYEVEDIAFHEQGVTRTVDDYDTGKTRKMQSKIVRVLEKMKVAPCV